MWKAVALAALSLLMINTAVAREILFKKRYEKLWDTQGWNVYADRAAKTGAPLLVLVNRNTMQIEILNAQTGATATQDSLNTKARNARLMEIFKTSSGEFLMAFAADTESGDLRSRVELHTLNSPVSYEVPFDTSTPLGLKMVERDNGAVELFVATGRNVEVYRRASSTLKQLRNQHVRVGHAIIDTGTHGQVQGQRSASWRLHPATVKRVAHLSIVDRANGNKRIDLPIGSATRIDDVGSFVFNGARHYFFVKDKSSLAIQNESSGAVIPNRRDERIAGVRLVPAIRSLAVMLESDSGSRLLVIELL